MSTPWFDRVADSTRVWSSNTMLRKVIQQLRADCGGDELFEPLPGSSSPSVQPPSAKSFRSPRTRLGLLLRSRWRFICVTAVLLPVIGAAIYSSLLNQIALGGVGPDVASAPPAFSWSSPEAIDSEAPYARAIPITSMSCASTTLCLAATENHGELISSTNPTGTTEGTWSVLQTSLISEGATGYALAGATCVTAESSPFCVATGRNFNDPSEPGIAITTTEPTGDASAWHKTVFPTGLTTPPVCAYESSTTLCLISTGFNSELLVSTEPSGGASAWTGIEAGFTGYGIGTSGAACPSTTFCAAVSYGAQFVASSEPTKQSAWSSPLAIGLENAESLACPTASFCLVAGHNSEGETEIATSTDPSAGASSTWSTSKPTGISELGYYGGVSCSPDTSVPGPHVICFAGAGGTVAVSTDGGSTWSPEMFPGTLGQFGPAPVSCPSNSLCVAGTEGGLITYSTDAASGESASWSDGDQVTEGSNNTELYPHSCPSTSLCVATDGAGRIMTSIDPEAGKSSWAVAAPIDPGRSLTSVECPSTGLCVATDNAGDVLTSSDPEAGDKSWSKPVRVAPDSIARLACPSASLCVVVDQEGNLLTSTDPAGGAGAWTAPTAIDAGEYIESLSCATATFCVITDSSGNVLTSTKPSEGASSWSHPENPDPSEPIGAIACPSSSLCVAASGVNILTTTNPAGGASTWSLPVSVGHEQINQIRCPSATLCVATDGNDVVQSTDPAGGGATWSQPAELGPQYPSELACPSIALCIASSYEGYVYTTTHPARGISGWSAAQQIDEAGELSSVACPLSTLCVFGDSAANIITGKAAAGSEGTETPTESEEAGAETGNEAGGGGSTGDHSTATAATTTTAPVVTSPPESTTAPIVGQRETASPVSGTVTVRLKGTSKFVPLSGTAILPNGSELDATHGRVQITVATPTPGKTQSAEVYGGRFRIEQSKAHSGETRLILSLRLIGCPRARLPHGSAAAVASATMHRSSSHRHHHSRHHRSGPRSRHLWVSENGGSWGTNGRYLSTSVEGTGWLTLDKCNRSTVRVAAGRVKVRDLVRHKTETITAGKSYVARRK
jgi:PQQ-like domain